MSDSFTRCLYEHCSPTLKKIKPSNLITLHKERYPDWKQDLRECYSVLSRHGYGLYLLRETDDFLVVMIYHHDGLKDCLSQREQASFLRKSGYSGDKGLNSALAFLRRRFQNIEFPHEIGLFLGYPMEDVRGFIRNSGANSKYTGDWKVYGDVNRAKAQFAAYRHSRQSVLCQAASGSVLEDILTT